MWLTYLICRGLAKQKGVQEFQSKTWGGADKRGEEKRDWGGNKETGDVFGHTDCHWQCFSSILSNKSFILCLFRWMNWWDRSWPIGSWLWIKKKVGRPRGLQKYSWLWFPLALTVLSVIYIEFSSDLTKELDTVLPMHLPTSLLVYSTVNLNNIWDVDFIIIVLQLSLLHIVFVTKQKKKAPKNGKRKKKDKDLTPDRFVNEQCLFYWLLVVLNLHKWINCFRTSESLFEELVEQELLKKAENVKLKDYLGIYCFKMIHSLNAIWVYSFTFSFTDLTYIFFYRGL